MSGFGAAVDIRRWALRALLIGLTIPGCGPSGPTLYDIEGTVTFDDQNVILGDILFTPDDARLAPEAGKIHDGRFTARIREGIHRVAITALDIRDDTPVVMGSPLAENFIPRWYNEETTLTITVSPDAEKNFAFELSSKPPTGDPSP